TYRLDIIPYEAGKGNPYADEGMFHYERTYFCHKKVGPNEDTYICPAKTFGKPCPICEERTRLSRDPEADEAVLKSLRPKERQLWNVFVYDQADKGVQVWDVSDWLFGKHLRAKVQKCEKYESFADPDDGWTLDIGANQESGDGMTWFTFQDIEFLPRE